MHRFHAPGLPGAGETFELPGEEARHLSQVLRLGSGETVRVFDGQGREHLAEVLAVRKARATLLVGAPVVPATEARVRVTLAPALLKGDRFDDVVRDAVMLGVWQIQPLVTRRTEVPIDRAAAAHEGGRWRRVAVASAKQCGRAVVPVVLAPRSVQEAVEGLPRPMLLLAEPSAGAPAGADVPPAPAAASLLVGPEGGWSPEEIAVASSAGASCLRLGARTLRADSAPLVALAVLLHEWDEL